MKKQLRLASVLTLLLLLALAVGISQAQGPQSFPQTDGTGDVRPLSTNTILQPQQQCPDPYEPNDSFGQAWNLVPPGTLHSYVCSVSDLDYFSLSANVGDTIYLTLYDLPANYDLCLYDPAQSLITCSNNNGTTKEVIEETASVTGQHYAMIYGVQGVYDEDTPYAFYVAINQPCTAVTDVGISGPTTVVSDTTHIFTATVSPPTATLSIKYTWQATEQNDVVQTGYFTQTATGFVWDTDGPKTITVTAVNCGGVVSATHALAVGETPDLIITDVWSEEGYYPQTRDICYQIRNIGDVVAPQGHYTFLSIDGQQVGTDLVDEDLAVGERLNRCFGLIWQCTLPENTMNVCADGQYFVAESDETNNCITETWKCDTTPPEITSGPTVSQIGQTSATVSWTTDEDSNSVVEFGTYAGEYEDQESDAAFSQSHAINLTGLVPATTYHYAVRSQDSSGNTVVSDDHFFRTAPLPDSVPPNISFFDATGQDLPLEFTAAATDNVGVDRVEFYLDGGLVQTDYLAPFQMYLDPAYMGMARGEFYADHTMEAWAFDEMGSVIMAGTIFSPEPECTHGEFNFTMPYDGYTILTFGDTAPPGTFFEFEAEASETEWEYVPIGPDWELEMGTPVAWMEFWVEDTRVYSSSAAITMHEYDWDASGLSVGEYTIKAIAHSHEDCVRMDQHTVVITSTRPDLSMGHGLVWEGNYATVSLVISNQGNEDATVLTSRIVDTMVGFQSVAETTADYTVEPSYDPESGVCETEVTFAGPIVLSPLDTFRVEYKAVPILYPGTEEYRIGLDPIDIEYREPGGDVFHETFSDPEEGDFFTLDVLDAIKTSDYLIVTNPYNLFALYNDTNVNHLLSKMAELATLPERNGVLGYFSALASHLTLFDSNDGFASGDVFQDDRDEIIVAHDEDSKIYLYSARGKWFIKTSGVVKVPFEHLGLHADDAIAAGDVLELDPLGAVGGPGAHPLKAEILIADGNGSNEGDVSIYQHWPSHDTFFDVDGFSSSYNAGDGFAVGDVEDDDWPEVIVANDGGTIDVHRRMPHGPWVDSSFISAFDHGDSLAVGDVTWDSKAEIVVATASGWIYVYAGDGTEIDSFDTGLGSLYHLAVGDIRGDDKAEIAVTDVSADEVHVYNYNHAGGVSHYDFALEAQAGDTLAAGSVFGDAKDELLLARGVSTDYRSVGAVEILYYFDGEASAEMYALEALLDGGDEWATKVHDDWASEGYLLLVGETEVIPTFSCSHEGIQVRYTDRYYASTSGDSYYPNVATGRIIGYDAADMATAIQTSIDIACGVRAWDTSDALAVSGYDACFSGSCADIDFSAERDRMADVLRARGFSDVDEGDMVATQPPTMDDDTFKDSRRDAFFGWTPDQDVIYLTGHGNRNVWDLVGSGHVDADFDPGDASPLVYAASCLTGLYPAGFSVAEAFLAQGASCYIGATEVSYSGYNPNLAEAFFNRLEVDRPVGDTFRRTKNDFISTGRRSEAGWRRYHGAIYHLYGDPKLTPSAAGGATHLGAAHVQPAASFDATAVISGPLSSIQVSIPDYVVTAVEGQDYVEIPGGGTVLELGEPMVPYYSVVISYPQGLQVQSVALAQRTGLITDTDLNLPTATLDIYGQEAQGAGPSGESLELWPDADFDWTVVQNPDDTTWLVLTIYPFFYNANTTDVHFYNDFTFDIAYADSPVEIIRLETDQVVYEQGASVVADVLLTSEQSGDVIVEAAVSSDDEGAVDGLPLRTLEGLDGLASFAVEWDSAGFEPGTYQFEIVIRGSDGTLLDRESTTFALGVSLGQVTDLSAAPERFSVGDTVAISMAFKNVGTVPISGTAVIRVLNESGAIVQEFRHDVEGLAPDSTVSFNDNWDSSGAQEGSYRVVGYVLYDSRATSIEVVTVSTETYIYLPIVLRNLE